jgi:hypothetical protein
VCKYPEVTLVAGHVGVSGPTQVEKRKCPEIARYRSNTQCPPPVNMMTKFITTNMSS